ncbi:hypothetical protein QR680_009484 [Steinernema hermaphroditum]|uniref:Uncharacterized protein n=1 Tax=Steinernema hermaphroditum TaxID=289476 RepID=A0AA39IKG4_9BILA|nr:hypothetical protein QR680_009484 [Steinernema hermaphroditum]
MSLTRERTVDDAVSSAIEQIKAAALRDPHDFNKVEKVSECGWTDGAVGGIGLRAGCSMLQVGPDQRFRFWKLRE